MSHLAKSDRPGAALQVESMPKDLVEPTTVGCISILQAWSRSEDEGAADRCYAILHHIKSQDRIKATARCYTPVITAFGREQRPQEAEAVLQELLEEYKRTKDPLLLPSVFP
jgi:pentatricopeptide repeat protein